MGFNTRYLPPLEELKILIKEQPEIVKYYLNADALIGSEESVDYVTLMGKRLTSKKSKKP